MYTNILIPQKTVIMKLLQIIISMAKNCGQC